MLLAQRLHFQVMNSSLHWEAYCIPTFTYSTSMIVCVSVCMSVFLHVLEVCVIPWTSGEKTKSETCNPPIVDIKFHKKLMQAGSRQCRRFSSRPGHSEFMMCELLFNVKMVYNLCSRLKGHKPLSIQSSTVTLFHYGMYHFTGLHI